MPRLGAVVIPQSVALEICALMAWDPGAGETAVIAWAVRHAGVEAVLDDSAARACAGVFGIRLRGTLSLVALAKRRGFIPAVRPVFAQLQAAGLFVTPALIRQVAQAVGE